MPCRAVPRLVHYGKHCCEGRDEPSLAKTVLDVLLSQLLEGERVKHSEMKGAADTSVIGHVVHRTGLGSARWLRLQGSHVSSFPNRGHRNSVTQVPMSTAVRRKFTVF